MTEEEKNVAILASHRITINYQSNAVAKKFSVNRNSVSSMDKEKLVPSNKWRYGQFRPGILHTGMISSKR